MHNMCAVDWSRRVLEKASERSASLAANDQRGSFAQIFSYAKQQSCRVSYDVYDLGYRLVGLAYRLAVSIYLDLGHLQPVAKCEPECSL